MSCPGEQSLAIVEFGVYEQVGLPLVEDGRSKAVKICTSWTFGGTVCSLICEGVSTNNLVVLARAACKVAWAGGDGVLAAGDAW